VSARAVPAPLAQLPNALTIGRLILVPIFVTLVIAAEGGHSWPAALVFAAAGATDQLDGYLARRWRVESEFGKIADPLADRLMIDAAVVLLFLDDRLPWEALAAILARDGLLIAGYKIAVPRGYDFSVNLLGKIATWFLFASLAFVLVTRQGDRWPLWIFWSGVAVAVLAAVVYGISAWRETRR
jgi:CDP-diacylglycerol--glycerol-3-phosphate 3-phosphatidyltransferase